MAPERRRGPPMRWLPAANGWGLCTACPSPSRTPSKWPACGQPAGPANWHTTCPAPTPPRSRGSRPPARWWSQDQRSALVGRHADLQRAVRHHQQPVGPGPGPRGIVRRIGGGGVLRLHGPRAGQRPRRLGARARTLLRGLRAQAELRVVPQRGYLDHVGGGTADADLNVFGPWPSAPTTSACSWMSCRAGARASHGC
jgi:hypothetical protein